MKNILEGIKQYKRDEKKNKLQRRSNRRKHNGIWVIYREKGKPITDISKALFGYKFCLFGIRVGRKFGKRGKK